MKLKKKSPMQFVRTRPWTPVYVNTVTPFQPELWANESLAILEENMVMANLVHRDFENEVAKYGSIVHTRKPGKFKAIRKAPADNVTVQDATSTDVMVPMNQHVHTSFTILDSEQSKSFKDLVETFLQPAMLAQATYIDQLVLGQYHRFLRNTYGSLGALTGSNARTNVLGTRQVMNQNKAYMDGRKLILTPASETSLLDLDLTTAAYAVGDGGEALRKAYLGQKFGFDTFMCQNAPYITAGAVTLAGTISNSGGYNIGAVTLTVTGFTGAVGTGDWVTIAGEMYPHRILSHTETLGNTTQIVLNEALVKAVANGAAVTAYVSGATVTNGPYTAGIGALSGGLPPSIGHSKTITLGSLTVAPQVGQMVTFGVATSGGALSSPIYTIMDQVGGVTTASITLDRPLEAALATSDVVHLGPPGAFNLAFHRNALALVVRPLNTPQPGAGALSAVVSYKGLSIRVTIQYQGTSQGHLVTIDMLCGIALLDADLGAIMLG